MFDVIILILSHVIFFAIGLLFGIDIKKREKKNSKIEFSERLDIKG
jgi:hypothetical protein